MDNKRLTAKPTIGINTSLPLTIGMKRKIRNYNHYKAKITQLIKGRELGGESKLRHSNQSSFIQVGAKLQE